MSQRAALSRPEFIALIAILFAMIAFSIDSMLPALPVIADELSPDDVNRAQLILTSFVLGMGTGTLFAGPLSDAFGRKPVILCGVILYVIGAGLAYVAQGLELVLLARFVAGLGGAAPRIVGLAIVRDLYKGREMARIMSFVMMVFTLFPAVAPMLGAIIMGFFGWRAIFLSFILFAVVGAIWFATRQPESLPQDQRRPIRLTLMRAALIEMFSHPRVRLSMLAQTLGFAVLFMSIILIQPIFVDVFDKESSFPLWFAGMALFASTGSFVNATLVTRLGMRKLASLALGTQTTLSVLITIIWFADPAQTIMFACFAIWMTTVMFHVGMIIGNLNAITMEPMGHIAGMAASISGAMATVVAAALAIPVGLSFDNTPLPLTIGVSVASFVAYWLLQRIKATDELVS
jgi:DHA1 family bicyclomycin/chloramphenicol resistance-like MFS transporter